MTNTEFFKKKNKIVFDVTGEILVPEDQMQDGPQIKLRARNSAIGLYGNICPYCKIYEDSCDDCPMARAGNKCTSEDSEPKDEEILSTWRICKDLWEEKSTAQDRQNLKDLIKKYNKGIKNEY